MATPPPCRDRSARKRVKPGIHTSEERISGESHVSVIQTMSGLESKTEEVTEERLDNILLTLKYRILSDVRDEDKVQVCCCVGEGWGGPEGGMGSEEGGEGAGGGVRVGQWIRKGRWEGEGRRIMVENTGLMN